MVTRLKRLRVVGVVFALYCVCTCRVNDPFADQTLLIVKPREIRPSASLKKPASSLYFLDSKTGWVLVNDNLYATVDGGGSWTKRNQRPISNCDDVVFATPTHGWLLCDQWLSQRRSNSVLATTNGGRSWRQVLEVPSPIFSLTLLDRDVGYVSSRWQPLHKTVNGGKAWTELDGIEGLNYVNFVDKTNAWGYGGAIWRTTNGGETWKQRVAYEQVRDLWTSSFIDANTGWIIGSGQLWRTTDGENWQRVDGIVKESKGFVAIDFVSAKEGWLATGDGSILYSLDGGATWRLVSKLPAEPVAIRFVTNLNGWALGKNGQLLRTDDGGMTWKPVAL